MHIKSAKSFCYASFWYVFLFFNQGIDILHKNIFIFGIIVYICYNEKQGSNPTLLFKKRSESMKNFKRGLLSFVLVCALIVSNISVMPSTQTGAAVSLTQSVTNLKFVENEDGTCTISWNCGLTTDCSYNIYRADSRYATYTKIGSTTQKEYVDNDYDGGYYEVRLVSGGKEYAQTNGITSYEIDTFGYNTNIFEPTDKTTEIQSTINNIYKTTEKGQFISDRNALLFAPGTYSNDLKVEIGFYTQVAGMGISPEDTVLGNINCKAEWMIGKKYDGSVNYNALCNFWRSVENLTTTANQTMWAVSQATSMRRMNIKGNLNLHQDGGYASGGFLADSKIAGRKYQYTDRKTGKKVDGELGISSGSQQQWLSRNVEMNKWDGSVWNYVFVGCEVKSLSDTTGTAANGPNGEWPYAAYTKVTKTPEVQEKPFLTVDEYGDYGVFVPALRKNSTGVSWDGGEIEGEIIGIEEFYVAKPGDSAAKINEEIKDGKNLILTPGIYEISEPIKIQNENTVVLGLGYATLKPTNGNQCMTIGDVAGVKIAGVLFDAGRVKSETLLTVGTTKNSTDNSENPTCLIDTFYRVGGADATPCKTTNCVIVNSNNVIGDNFWIWRADHGAGVAWDKNTADTGVIFNGDNITTYGLMVEHFQKYQTVWNGNGGKCYMYQSELPYDITSQNVWNASGSYGYTDYKVSDKVTSHEGYGIGIYSCYQKAQCFLKSAIECPDTPNVKFTNVCTYSLSGNGGIDYAINKAGYGVYGSGDMCKVMSYSNGKFTADKTYEQARKNIYTTYVEISGKGKYDTEMTRIYTGKVITPKVKVVINGVTLRQGTDYTVTYSKNKKIGNGKIVVKGIGAYKNTATIKLKIRPARAKIKKKKATKKKITVKYNKSKGATGYEVSYSTKKNFKKKYTVTKKTRKRTFTFKRKAKSAYYVRVRSYKKVGKKYYYSKYTKKYKFKKK